MVTPANVTTPAPLRIIRPALGAPEGGPSVVSGVNLEDLQRLGERLIRDARERVDRLQKEAEAIEAALRAQRAALGEERARAQQEIAALHEAAICERAAKDAELRAQAQAGYEAGLQRGQAEGNEKGFAEGREAGYRVGAEEGRRAGLEAGCVEGREAERARLAAEAAPALEAFRVAATETLALLERQRKQAHAELLPLAVDIARKIVKREIRECPDVALRNVLKAIDLVYQRANVQVQAHPEDVAALEAHLPEIHAAFHGIKEITITPADDVGRGGCRVLAGAGRVDMRVESQLELIEQSLFGLAVDPSSPAPTPPEAKA